MKLFLCTYICKLYGIISVYINMRIVWNYFCAHKYTNCMDLFLCT